MYSFLFEVFEIKWVLEFRKFRMLEKEFGICIIYCVIFLVVFEVVFNY